MARIKKPLVKKSRRRRPPTIEPKRMKKAIRNMGGCLPNPPMECPYRRRASDGGIWTDFGCCLSLCHEICDTYKRICKATLDERKAYWKECGVINF
jgi:hypothetical protein